jgi:hypothetical protein
MNFRKNDDTRHAILDGAISHFCRDNRIDDGRWRFSDAGFEGMDGYCRRKRVWHHFGFAEKRTTQNLLTLARGHLAEERALQVLNLWKPVLAHPFDHQGGLTITLPSGGTMGGRMDFLLPPFTAGEIKSISADAILKEPHQLHVCQLVLNMFALSRTWNTSGHDGMLCYFPEGRELDVQIFDIPPQMDLLKLLIDETDMLDVNFAACRLDPLTGEILNEDEQVVPNPGLVNNSKFPCQWATRKGKFTCGYYKDCWPDNPVQVGPHRPVRAVKPRAPRRRRTA